MPNTNLTREELLSILEPNVGSIKIKDLESRGVSQCDKHSFRKLNDKEVACTNCPTVLIVEDADYFLNSYGR